MSTHDHELLSQYIDGELSPAQSQDLRARLENEPALEEALARMENINACLVNAFAAGCESRVPAHVASLLADGSAPSSSNVIPFPGNRLAGWQMAVAASLVVAVGAVLVQRNQHDAVSPGMMAGNDVLLSAALDTLPSAGEGWEVLPDGRQLRPVLTFPSNEGQWCREFLLSEAGGDWRGVACRQSEQWVTQAVARETFLSASDSYRPAGAADSDEISGFILLHAADIALSGAREAELIDNNWE